MVCEYCHLNVGYHRRMEQTMYVALTDTYLILMWHRMECTPHHMEYTSHHTIWYNVLIILAGCDIIPYDVVWCDVYSMWWGVYSKWWGVYFIFHVVGCVFHVVGIPRGGVWGVFHNFVNSSATALQSDCLCSRSVPQQGLWHWPKATRQQGIC